MSQTTNITPYFNDPMPITVSSTISVSSPIHLNCEKLAEFLSNSGIITSVSSNISTVPSTVEFRNQRLSYIRKEYGCRLVQTVESKNEIQTIWEKLKKEYGFNCAHITVGNQFDGCILNYLAPSQCKQP